tara:strand:- start:945 stop:1142 length:198 start_codon:yes stop_codon:yes gene_type:complete
MKHEPKKTALCAAENVPTGINSKQKNGLSQTELRAGWPFAKRALNLLPEPKDDVCLGDERYYAND